MDKRLKKTPVFQTNIEATGEEETRVRNLYLFLTPECFVCFFYNRER